MGTEQQVTRHNHSVTHGDSSHPTTKRGNARLEHREHCYRHRTVIQGLMGPANERPEQQQPRGETKQQTVLSQDIGNNNKQQQQQQKQLVLTVYSVDRETSVARDTDTRIRQVLGSMSKYCRAALSPVI